MQGFYAGFLLKQIEPNAPNNGFEFIKHLLREMHLKN